MLLNNQDFAHYLQQKLGFTDEQVSTKPLRKLAQQKAQKLIKGKSTITYGGKILQLSPKKKIDANTFGGKNQFKPVLPTTDFMRVYLARNISSIPEFIVIDLDDNNVEQFKSLVKLIPEAKNTLVTRTSKEFKYHVWFKYPQPSAEQVKNMDYIVQTRTTKSTLLPDFNTDIFTTGVLFEGYLTNRRLKNAIREPKNYTNCIARDNDIQTLTAQSVAILKGSVDNGRAKRSLSRGGGYLVYSDPTLAATMRKYISSIDIIDKLTDKTELTHICADDVMYIYNSIFNPAEYVDVNDDANPFIDDDASSETSISVYNYDSNKVTTKILSKLPQKPTAITSLNMPVPQGNWDYYNNVALKVHSQCHLTFDERQAFIEKWLTKFVIPASAKKLSLVVWREMFWDEFSPGDIPYEDSYSNTSIASKPQSLDDYVFGDYSMSGKWLYVPTLYSKYGTSKLRLVQVNIETEVVRTEGDEVVLRTLEDVRASLEATAIRSKEAELNASLAAKQKKAIKESIGDWVVSILNIETVFITSIFKYGKYDTMWWDEDSNYPILNTLKIPDTFKITKHKKNIISNLLFKQINMTLASKEKLFAFTGEELQLKDGTPITYALYYCLMLAYTLFNEHAPLGRFIMYGEGRTGKTRLVSTIPRLLFGDKLVFTVNKDNYKNNFTPDYANIRLLSFNEVGYAGMTRKENETFSEMLKDITEYNGWTRKELKSSNAKDQRVDVLALESTNDIPTITPDDTRVIVVEAMKCTDKKLVQEVHEGIKKLKSNSSEVLEFAQYLRYLYDTEIPHSIILSQALTMNAPSSKQKKEIQIQSVNNTRRLHDMLLVNGDLTPIEDMRDGSKVLDSMIDFVLNRKPIVYRQDINRIIIHMYDLRLLYWILSKKDETPYTLDIDKNVALKPGTVDYGNFGISATKAVLLNALKVTRFYDVQVRPKDKDNHIVEMYDKLTGMSELLRATDKRKNSYYTMITPTSQLGYNIDAGYAQHVNLIKTIDGE